MTVAAFPPYTYYWGDGVTTAFAFPFEVARREDFVAYQDDLLVTNYQLHGLGEELGGICTFSTPPAVGAALLLLRRVPLDQETMYPAYSPFPAAAHEKTLDRLCMQVWQMQEQLERASTLKQTIRPPWRNLVLPDPLPNTVLGWDSAGAQWTLYPTGVVQIVVDPVSGIGWGKNTIAITPVAGAAQGTGLLFPAGVLAVAVTVWVKTTFGLTQGLQQVGLGTPDLPDCWGFLPALSAETTTTAGLFQAYGGQPHLGGGMVALTAYGGRFDGTGTAYVTGHFMTFGPAREAGYSYHPGSPDESQPLPPVTVPLASELEPGLIELLNATEVLQDTDLTRAVTIGRLVSRTATPTRLGLVRTATPAAVGTGTNDTDAATPLGVKTALDARLPAGTALRVPRYGASGQALESSALTSDPTTGNLGLRTAAPAVGLHLVSEVALQSDVQLDHSRNTSSGTQVIGRRARGTLAAPARLQLNDILVGLRAFGWVRNAADTADDFVQLGDLRYAVDEVDAQGRGGGNLRLFLSAGGSATPAQVLYCTQAGNLLLGSTGGLGTDATRTLGLGPGVAPSTSPPDVVQLTAVDRGGTAGKRSLHVRTEDSTSHLFGDLSGIGTTLNASLGSGASYQSLNVKGSVLTVGQSSVQERAIALAQSAFVVSTDASRTSRWTLSVYDATAAREGLRIETSGTAPMIGFLGALAVARQTVPAAATDATTTQALANSLRTALINFGLCV